MSGLALGMIETRGLVAAIEAADAALKASNVRLVSREKVKGAIINIKFVGDVAAVKSAVDAGAAAAGRIGELLAAHVISSPSEDLESLIYNLNSSESRKEPDPKEEPKPDTSDNSQDEIQEVENDEESEENDSIDSGQLSIEYNGLNPEDEKYLEELKAMNVQSLRKTARETQGLQIIGRQISIANKGKLIQELMKTRLEK